MYISLSGERFRPIYQERLHADLKTSWYHKRTLYNCVIDTIDSIWINIIHADRTRERTLRGRFPEILHRQ